MKQIYIFVFYFRAQILVTFYITVMELPTFLAVYVVSENAKVTAIILTLSDTLVRFLSLIHAYTECDTLKSNIRVVGLICNGYQRYPTSYFGLWLEIITSCGNDNT